MKNQACTSRNGSLQVELIMKGMISMFGGSIIKTCGRFCHWFGRCLNQHEGECLGYMEPDDEEDEYERIDRLTY